MKHRRNILPIALMGSLALWVNGPATAINAPVAVENREVPAQRTFHFGVDEFAIKERDQGLLEAHGRYLSAHKDRSIVLEGHTDEVGGREYNVALGQKRADWVRQSILRFGASESQVTAITFGEEKPIAKGRNKTSRNMNRRVRIVYQ